MEARAFDKLKLVVEVDFSWNKLSFVPAPQLSHLSLLRRLSLRGNPLLAVDELSLSGGLKWPEAGKQSEQSVALNMSRLLETYPDFARAFLQRQLDADSLIKSGKRLNENENENENGPNSSALEALNELVQQEAAELESQDSPDSWEKSPASFATSLGDHFGQLQELDLGQCKLSYIKWSCLQHLKQLKRLLLDGNRLR